MVVSGEVVGVLSQSWESKQLFICGGWSEPPGQPHLSDWQVCLSPTARATTWRVQLGSHCLSRNELLGLLYRMSADSRKQNKEGEKKAGMGGVVCGIGCCKEDCKEDSANAVAWFWREETGA